jgi:hypothetical protein
MSIALPYGDEVWQGDYEKTHIGCSFDSYRPRGSRATGLNTTNLHSHSWHTTKRQTTSARTADDQVT